MPKNPNVKKVLVIGSGPIVIGQAAEFDYAGTQACRSLKEEGVEVVLINSNPASLAMISSRAMNTASLAAWSYFIEYYVKAFEVALNAAAQRIGK